MQIIDYTILSVTSSPKEETSLGDQIRDHIKQGWQPFGSLTANGNENGFIFVQAMVKYAKLSGSIPDVGS